MSLRNRANSVVQSSLERVKKTTGRALGNEDMPVDEQVEELKVYFRLVGDKVTKSTGRALGDEDMPVKDQVKELKGHLKVAGTRVRDAFKKWS